MGANSNAFKASHKFVTLEMHFNIYDP